LLLLVVIASLFAFASPAFAQVRPIVPTPRTETVALAQDPEEEEEKEAEEEPARTPVPGTTPMQPLVAAAPSPGQNTAAAPPGSTPAATLPPSPTANPPPGAPATVRLQFPNSDIVDVLHLYEQLTGNKLVMDNFVQGKVNIFITRDVSREEAIKIIEMSMALNGISMVPAAPGIVEVVGLGQNPRKAVVPIISDLADIPPGNPVVSFVFHLRYADPQELQQVLTAYFQGSSGVINILALPKSGALLVTQNADIVRQIATVIQQVDVAPAEVVSEFIKLERADASKVVEMMKDIFEKGSQTPTGPGGYRVPVPQPLPQPVSAEGLPGPEVGALTEEAVVVGKIKLTADVRTNRIHVVTRPINMPFIRKLVKEFDANVEFAKPVTRPLRYISAGDVLPVLVQALTEPGAPSQPGGAGVGGSPAPQPTPSRTTPTAGTSTTAYTGGFPGTTGGTSETGTLNISEELSTQPVDTTPKAVTIGNAKLIADQRANSIIILGSREVVVKIEKILDEMDVKAPQVALSTVIGELTLSDNEDFGVDYFVRHSRGLDVAGTTSFTGITPATGGGTVTASGTPVGASIFDPGNLITFTRLATNAAGGANVFLAAGKTLAAVVHALEATNRFRVINRPTVFTSNNKKAIIASGQEIPVPVNTLTNVVPGVTATTGTAAVTSSIEFKRIALQLEVVPLINSEKEVSLDILQKLDSRGPDVVISGNPIPTIQTRYVRTNVSAPTGSTIVLGGLIQDQKQRTISGIPILDKLPYVGAIFRHTSDSNMRTELIVLMCPEVTLTNLDLYRLRQEKEDKTHFGPEIDQGECPDCPPRPGEGKQLPPPDLPFGTK
jgi:general secretion pathway protein D